MSIFENINFKQHFCMVTNLPYSGMDWQYNQRPLIKQGG